jgi:phospholipid transport system transporter-binding protein
LVQLTAKDTLAQLLQALPGETSVCVTVNASALGRFDSTALAVLLDLRRAVLAMGKTIALQGVPGRLTDLARLYGIAELLPSNG